MSNDSGVVENGSFQCSCWRLFGNFIDEARSLYSSTQSVVGFSVILKCMTFGDYFALNSVFAPVFLASDCAIFENNGMKTNKDRHILSAAQIFGRTLVSGSVRFVRIFMHIL